MSHLVINRPREQFSLFERGGAQFSADRVYRYKLWRDVGGNSRACAFIMLNPSTGDERDDDPTLRRCLGFARRERCGLLIVGNLYARVSSDPRALADGVDPVGPENDAHLRDIVRDVTATGWHPDRRLGCARADEQRPRARGDARHRRCEPALSRSHDCR